MLIGDKLYFSPNFKFNSLKWDDSANLTEAFKDRVLGFYLAPGEELCKDRHGFACGLICVAAIDFLARIETGETHASSRITKWLSTHIPSFSRVMPRNGNLTYAEFFYSNFRNGLVHEGRIKQLGQFSLDEPEIVTVKKEVMLVNPQLLLSEIKTTFFSYLEDLRNNQKAFAEFRESLHKDFGKEVSRSKRLSHSNS